MNRTIKLPVVLAAKVQKVAAASLGRKIPLARAVLFLLEKVEAPSKAHA